MKNHRCNRLFASAFLGLLAIAAGPATGQARVVDLEVLTVAGPVFDGAEYGPAGSYERIDARAHFAVDPNSPRVAGIVDIDKVPVNDAGEVTFSTDVVILRPSDPARRGGVLFYEVPNRGRNLSFLLLNRSANSNIPQAADDAGDGFLMRQGYTLVWSGWQADLTDEKLMQLHLPSTMMKRSAKPGCPIRRPTSTPPRHNSRFDGSRATSGGPSRACRSAI